MNAEDAKRKMKSMSSKQRGLLPPSGITRQTTVTAVQIKDEDDDDDDDDGLDHIERGEVKIEEANEPATVTTANGGIAPATNSGPSASSELNIFIQGNIMSNSTSMSTLNQQLQKLQQEVMEKQSLMNEVRSKMLSIQGSIAMLQNVAAKMRELNFTTDEKA